MAFETLIFTHKLKGVKLRRPFHEPVTGTLCITGHHLIFHCPANKFQELWVLHHSINTVEKHMESPLNGGTLTLKCKDFKVLHFDIRQYQEFLNVLKSIDRLANFRTVEFLYPFFYQPMYTIFEDGYTLFKIESEFSKLLATDAWRISHVNKDYDVCKTYSAAIIVPKIISDDIIVASANFREGGRFPVLSYRHESGAILLRSSQPLLNNCYRRCSDDENILNALLSPLHKGYIIDTRSASYINSCKAKGGGTEPDEHYIQWKKVFTPLDKISKSDGSVLDSLTKLVDACNDNHCLSDKWLSKLEACNWLTYIQQCVNAACLIAQCLDKDCASVLVHGAQGLDSTLILTSLTQVILNPDCRTFRGLQALIDREWLQAGHPFHIRNWKSCYSNITCRKLQQPTFLIFLDCMHQLLHQFPYSFEFKIDMLIVIFEHSYFSQFGTFLGNCEYDRIVFEIFKRTTSLWSYLNHPDTISSLINPVYEPNKLAIWPSVAPVSLKLWNELYLRWIVRQTQSRKIAKIEILFLKGKELRRDVIKMKKKLINLLRSLH